MKRLSVAVIFCLAAVVSLIVIVLARGVVREKAFEADAEFVYCRKDEATNITHMADYDLGDYLGPSASFLFEERLRKYEPRRMLEAVYKCLLRDYPDSNDGKSEVKLLLDNARYYNTGMAIPHVHVIVRSVDADQAVRVARSFANAVAEEMGKDISIRIEKSIFQIDNCIAKRKRYVDALSKGPSTSEPKTLAEIEKIKNEIKLLEYDKRNVLDCCDKNEGRIFLLGISLRNTILE